LPEAEEHADGGDETDGEDRERKGHRAMWTGSVSFGLVSVPVELHAAARGSGPRMRMLAADGTPLERRYRCPAHDCLLAKDEIVRGYPIREEGNGEGERFVVVEDAELQALAPERSRELALERFVPHEQLPLPTIDRTYYLVPRAGSPGTVRGYRLLATVMERAGLAGIGSFVIRGHAHLVAIVARGGLLRAELLRFADEVRGPRDVGLPRAPAHLDEAVLEPMRRALRPLYADQLELEALYDDRTDRLQALAEEQLERGEGVVEVPEAAEPSPKAAIDDLMRVLKEQLEVDAHAPGP